MKTMNITMIRNSSRIVLAAALSAAALPVLADDHSTLKINGTVDLYYQRDLGDPSGDIGFRAWDNKINKVTLNTALAKIRWTPAKSPLSFAVDFGIGRMQDVSNLVEPAGRKKYKNFQQAYVTYTKGKNSVDLGKFLTWMGYEGIENGDNPNYSQGYIFVFGVPTYHMGLRTGFKSGGSDVQLFAVKGWNEVEDSNGNVSLGARVARDIDPTTNVALGVITGIEGDGNGAGGAAYSDGLSRDTTTFSLVATKKQSDKMTFVLEGLYGNGLGRKGSSTATWTGFAGYAIQQINPKLTGSLRLEAFNDTDGGRTGVGQNLASATLTGKLMVAPNANLMIELRTERSNKSVFASDSGLKKDRITLAAGYTVKF
jgi:hypothetical protein